LGLTGDDGVLRRCPSVPRSRSDATKIPNDDERDGGSAEKIPRREAIRVQLRTQGGDEERRRRNGEPTNGEDVDDEARREGEHGVKRTTEKTGKKTLRNCFVFHLLA
jgi:hypothetical protein